jgi:outer membrane protein
MNRAIKSLCILLLVGLPCAHTMADGGVTRTPIVDAPPESVGLGFGLRFGASPYRDVDNTSSITSDNNFDLLPLYLYEGEYLYFHGSSWGLHAYNNGFFDLDILARARFDRLEAGSSPYLEGMEDREQSIDAGFAMGLTGNWGELRAEWVRDTLGRHKGEELDLTYRYNYEFHKWMFSPFVSYIWQNQKLANYYYGVRPGEANGDRPEYEASEQHFYRLGINSSYHLTPRWLVFANLAYEHLGSAASASPLTDTSHTTSAMLGASYFFGQLSRATIENGDGTGSRENEWSWRVNYGYTAEATFHKVHRGDFRRSTRVDTNLAGFTVGKLLQAGPRVEYYGKFSLNRRLENGYQDDFWEYSAYVIAMGRGYSPWSNREVFRYGLGFGFSYAEKIPVVEQEKQAGSDDETSHFLTYMEAQLDFPLRNFFKAPAIHNCYAGLTIVHRSGIFATSDILGNVSGGSDVLSVHLECMR